MENLTELGWIGMISILTAGLTIAIGAIAPAIGEGLALSRALASLAQQPDEANTITRTLFVGLALVESTAILLFCGVDDFDFCQPPSGTTSLSRPGEGKTPC